MICLTKPSEIPELHPKSWTPPANFKRCSFLMSKYNLHFKYRAVHHYHQVHSQRRTAEHFNVSRTHLRRWIAACRQGGIAALQHPQATFM
ncbi:helix-turn-helix domain-containing protein, partial [Neisseria weixii]|uniref:helix-turn-helix domain-containing protein n=1 Tax=Neisseria weixii TaxID=1853276 RepID=UPI0035A15F4F